MRKSRMTYIALVLLLLGLIPLFGLVGVKVVERFHLYQARRGLEEVEAALPALTEFRHVTTVSDDFQFRSIDAGNCYYATDYLIMGASLPERQALDVYEDRLHTAGWIPSEKQFPDARVLSRGENTLLVITTNRPSFEISGALDYDGLRQEFASVVFVRVEFHLPKRSDCSVVRPPAS